MSGNLKVTVKQAKNARVNYTIGGSGVSDDEFSFTRFSISKIHPLFGPRCDGVNVHIKGDNLHTSSEKQFNIFSASLNSLASCEWITESLSPSEITCITGRTLAAADSAVNFTISIDGAKMSTAARFSVQPGPVITSVFQAGLLIVFMLSLIVGSRLLIWKLGEIALLVAE